MSYWKTKPFWDKVKDSVHGVLAITQLSLVLGDAQHVYNVITFAGQVIGLLIPIWFDDKNQNGKVDAFEKEVTVKVKSDTPIEVETEVKKTEP
jgi:hypothetical protein